MTTKALKKELHDAIENTDDQSLLEAVYTILRKNQYSYDLSAEQKRELQRRYKLHEQGRAENIPVKKSLKIIRDKISKF